MVHKNNAVDGKIGLGGLMSAMERRGIKTEGMADDQAGRGGKQYADAPTIFTEHEDEFGYRVKRSVAGSLVDAIRSGKNVADD